MLINGGMRITSLSARPVQLTRGDINRVRMELPPDFRIGRVFELSGKTVVMHKDLPGHVTNAAETTLRSAALLLSRMPERNLCFIGEDIPQASEAELAFMGRVIKFPDVCSELQAKQHVLCELAEFLPDEQDGSVHLIVSPDDQIPARIRRADESLNIKKKLDPLGYCSGIAVNALSGSHPETDINKAVSLIPLEVADTLSPDRIVDLVKLLLRPSGGLNVRRKNDYGGGSVIESQIVRDAYFGVGHDIVSVFAGLGLEPLDMKFYPVGGDNNRVLCLSTARFVSEECGTAKVISEMDRLFEDDAANRALLSGEGDLLWFSFVGLYNAMSRFLASSDQARDSIRTVFTMKKNGPIMRAILSELRARFDPSYPAEAVCGDGMAQGTGVEETIAHLPEDEAGIMRFCLDFARSVRKTDYFDVNRLKEISSFLLNADQLKSYIDAGVPIRPEEILFIHRRSHGIELHPIYAVERKTKTERYAAPAEIALADDSSISDIMAPYVRNVRLLAAAKALEIMPFIEDMTDRELSIFEGMSFIDEDGREFNISGVRPNTYLSVTAGALFSRLAGDGSLCQEPTYMENISKGLGTSPQEIDHMSIKFLGRGGLRTISTVKIHSGGTTNTFLAAVNRPDLRDSERGHAAEEYEAIRSVGGSTTLLPVSFGFVSVPMQRTRIGVLFKEFLMGLDCEQYLNALSKEKGRRAFFRAIGASMGQLYAETGMGSSDFKLSNMVFFRDRVRFCDICPLTDDMGMVKDGFIQLFDNVPTAYRPDLVEGIIEQGDPGREFMGRIRENMLYDNEDSWQSMTTWEDLNNIAAGKGVRPEEYYRWKLT